MSKKKIIALIFTIYILTISLASPFIYDWYMELIEGHTVTFLLFVSVAFVMTIQYVYWIWLLIEVAFDESNEIE